MQCSYKRILMLSSLLVFLILLQMIVMFPGKSFQWMVSEERSISLKQLRQYMNHTLKTSFREPLNSRQDKSDRASTCVFPDVNIYEPSVVEIAGMNLQTLHCEGTYLPDLTYVEGRTIIVKTSKVDANVGTDRFQHCKYRHIWRHDTDDNNYTYSDWSESFTDKIKLPRHSEFVRVQCWDNTTDLISNTYYFLVPRKEEFDDLDKVNFKKREVESAPKETLNVIMIAMDSLQRHQFIRGCNKTYSYLMNTLKSFDLTMHSQMGKNTFPNFLPLFTDHLVKETTKWWTNTMPMDPFDMLWLTFEKAGYCTMYTESSPQWGGFNWLNKGFTRPFARFYARPIDLAIQDDIALTQKRYCAGNQLEMNMRLGYICCILDTFPDKPVFAVATMSLETHDYQANAKLFDEHILNFYKSLRDKGHLNRTLLISLSDHGTRWGKLRDSVNGHFDSVTPYTILTFPEWFLKKYPDVAENLRTNTKRLTSHFDTHATLLDLLYFKSDTPPPLAPIRHGMSLFKEIPWNRTCVDASIPAEFCLCGYKEADEINIDSELSKKLSQVFMKSLNRQIESVCVPYSLNQIMRVTKIVFDGDDSKETPGDAFYRVKLQTSPGDGIFEAYIYVEQNSTVWKLGENVFRLNYYKGQSDCAKHPASRPMCYCKNLLTKS